MNEKKKELICIRCGKSARDSGVPDICKKCAKEMEYLAKKIGDIRVLYLKGKSIDYILRSVRKEALKTLQNVLEVEEEEKE